MPLKNSGGSTKFPGGHKVIHRTAQTAFVRVVTPRSTSIHKFTQEIKFCFIWKYIVNQVCSIFFIGVDIP